jgi:Ni/Co efflux regulator RcnB
MLSLVFVRSHRFKAAASAEQDSNFTASAVVALRGARKWKREREREREREKERERDRSSTKVSQSREREWLNCLPDISLIERQKIKAKRREKQEPSSLVISCDGAKERLRHY